MVWQRWLRPHKRIYEEGGDKQRSIREGQTEPQVRHITVRETRGNVYQDKTQWKINIHNKRLKNKRDEQEETLC